MSIRPLSKQLQEKAERELSEVPSRIRDDLAHIRDWLEKQPHLNARKDDQWLLNFLRNCKFSLQRTKEKLDFFYTMRSLVPELYSDRHPSDPTVQGILENGAIIPLMEIWESTSPVAALVRYETVDPGKFTNTDLMKVAIMLLDIAVHESDNIVVSGLHWIVDLNGFSGFVTQFTPSVAKMCVTVVQDTYPVRLKGIHFLHAPAMFTTVFAMIKPFMKEKIRKRVYFHSDAEELHKYFPRCILPKQYGGDAGSIDQMAADCKRKVESYREWFLEEAQYRSDESKRPGQPITASEILGVDGSFRKLDID